MDGEVGDVLEDLEAMKSIFVGGAIVMTKSGAACVRGQRRPRPPACRPS